MIAATTVIVVVLLLVARSNTGTGSTVMALLAGLAGLAGLVLVIQVAILIFFWQFDRGFPRPAKGPLPPAVEVSIPKPPAASRLIRVMNETAVRIDSIVVGDEAARIATLVPPLDGSVSPYVEAAGDRLTAPVHLFSEGKVVSNGLSIDWRPHEHSHLVTISVREVGPSDGRGPSRRLAVVVTDDF